MKLILPLVVASLMVAIATAMFEDGPFTLPFLIGYLLGIVVPLVVYSGILTLVARLSYRMLMRKDLPNLPATLWSIWVLVAAINLYGNYHLQKVRQSEITADPFAAWEQQGKPQGTADDQGKNSEIVLLQAKFARDSKQLDATLAEKVVSIQIPALFDPAFLAEKTHFPTAVKQLEEYGQVFQRHIDMRKNMLAQLKNEIEHLDLPQKEKQQALQEFSNTYEIDAELARKYYDIVIEVSRQGIEYLDFMKRGRYSVLDGQLIFETDKESEEHRTHLQTFQRLSEQEATTQQELASSREARMARMHELSR